MRLRPATQDDVGFVMRLEADEASASFVTRWSATTHAANLQGSDHRYLIVETESGQPVGFVILVGYAAEARVIELARIMVREPGRGLGRQAMRLVMAHVFADPRARHLWLDVYSHNPRAHHVYASLGFTEERREDVAVGTLIFMGLPRARFEALPD